MKINLRLICVVGCCLLMAGMAQAASGMSPSTEAPAGDAADADALPIDPFETPADPFSHGTASLTVADPISGFNRAMFTFNDRLYFWVLKPVASGYRAVLPTPVRVSVKNFFYNLLMPVRLVNCLLQGKGEAAQGEFCRFVVNTTAGMGGFLDPAADYPKMNPSPEDLGQTLGTYGVGNGFYIIWPVFGPSTVRDTVGSAGDWALNPFSFMKLINADAGALTSSTTNVAVYSVRVVNNTSFHIGDYEALKRAALDPYEAFRNAYIQNRASKVAE